MVELFEKEEEEEPIGVESLEIDFAIPKAAAISFVYLYLGVIPACCNSISCELRQEHQEFQVSLNYIANLGST